jgi:acetolactate synthase-1/2/3 large subunit
VFADIGNTLVWAERNLMSFPDGQFVCLTGLSAMGSATAAIIGGKLGRPTAPAVCLCGDGDFHMTGMEVATAASHKIPVVWVVLKNDQLGMIHNNQALTYQNRYIASDFSSTDFAAFAEAVGAKGLRVDGADGVLDAVASALEEPGPAVIEVRIDAEELPPTKPRMMALKRSMGNPDVLDAISWDAIKALWTMVKER